MSRPQSVRMLFTTTSAAGHHSLPLLHPAPVVALLPQLSNSIWLSPVVATSRIDVRAPA